MFNRLLRGSAALALAATALTCVSAAAAQTTRTLTGETLNADPTSPMTVECGATTSRVTFDAFGTAIGPYPGTFTEQGEVIFHNGEVTHFHASFSIDSAGTTITGTKDLDPEQQALVASCGPAAPFAEFAQVVVFARYTAQIDGPLGTSTETGVTSTSLDAGEMATGETTLTMSESFQSGGPPGLTIELSPLTAVNSTGTMHTVTAIVRDATTQPVQGITVRFVITGSSAQTTRCVTNQDGRCDLTYLGPDTPGADEITACADTNLDGDGDPPTEPCAAATKAWSPGGGTTQSGAHGGGHIGEAEVVFGFSAESTGPADPVRGACNVFDRVGDIHVKCLDITTLLVTPGHATFSGTAEQDGIATTYTITVNDLSDSGLPDTFTIETEEGYVKTGPVTAGNIVVNP